MTEVNRFPAESFTPMTPWGCRVSLRQDSCAYYYMVPGQKFIPHEIVYGEADSYSWHALHHPFLSCGGLLVGVNEWVAKRWLGGVAVAHITRVRTMRLTRYGHSHQVEILGLPTMWFAASHFERIV